MINQHGQIVKQLDLDSIQEDVLNIKTDNLDNGFYYLSVEVENHRAFTEKVIIRRMY